MNDLKGRKILLAITGGIAAYKVLSLVRLLIQRGAELRCIMSPEAKEFITPLSLSTLSGSPVYSDFKKEDGSWVNHVELAMWAELMVIAPCTAHTLGKLSHGICDNLLLATYLSAKSPVLISPAMDLDMYAHPTTIRNIQSLREFGNTVLEAEVGLLASGLEGQGRMPEPENILNEIKKILCPISDFEGKKILLTAGPTYESIDPVRFIGNHSSGKMGFAIAEEAAQRGAEVILISGPVHLNIYHPKIQLIRVKSANEMLKKVMEHYEKVDIAIATAAVSDYAPKEIAKEKIKKQEKELNITLVKNPDILFEMGQKKEKQYLVGFALETHNELDNARKKLEKKNLDLIILNSLNDSGAGFQGDTNRVDFITEKEIQSGTLKSKKLVAWDILDFVSKKINNQDKTF